MKSLISFLFVVLFCVPHLLPAQNSKYVKAGFNYSTFRTEGGKSTPGLVFGIGKDSYTPRWSNVFWGGEICYVRKTTSLNNKSWPGGMDPSDADLVTGNIKADISFIEIPLKIGYTSSVSKAIDVNLQVGPVFSIPIKNHTKLENRQITFLGPEERGYVDFDYILTDFGGISGAFGIQYGVSCSFKSMTLLFSYSYAFLEMKGFTNISVKDELDSFQLILAHSF